MSDLDTELLIERMIVEKIGHNHSAYVHLNGTAGKILIRIYGIKINEPLIFEKELLEELGIKKNLSILLFL